ncbi:hypothetical protein J5N97_003151 [Dioscorea zingiberensis]|uniref:Uncharacterized protein n=1 Tax=Dioscorea zingiberensis TaxID=325984 RepID=A0A9D5HPT7_9LILI|nr:hypothetical protein J5N97_003151 [Dioscorea zingiberensis]
MDGISGQLRSLEYLRLSNNSLSGAFPVSGEYHLACISGSQLQAAFLFTVVGTTSFLGVIAGQLPGI